MMVQKAVQYNEKSRDVPTDPQLKLYEWFSVLDHILKNARRIRDTTHRPQVDREAQTVYPLYDNRTPVRRDDYVFLL